MTQPLIQVFAFTSSRKMGPGLTLNKSPWIIFFKQWLSPHKSLKSKFKRTDWLHKLLLFDAVFSLLKWLANSATCPQCRSRATQRSAIKLFFEVGSDASDIDPSKLKVSWICLVFIRTQLKQCFTNFLAMQLFSWSADFLYLHFLVT